MEDSPRWEPDDAMVLTVRTRVLPHGQLSGPDRAWVVASLTVQGWTVAAIAERLRCSLRLVQQIKAEPMTLVALYALSMRRQLSDERSLRRLESLAAARQHTTDHATITRITSQRDALLDYLAKEHPMPAKPHIPNPTATCPVCTGLLGDLQFGEQRHTFCSWAGPQDWAALRPWLTGTLDGVHAAGG